MRPALCVGRERRGTRGPRRGSLVEGDEAVGHKRPGELRQRGRDVGGEAVIDLLAAPLGRHDPGLTQDTQVMRDRWLTHAATAGEVAGTGLRLARELTDDGQPRRVRQCSQQANVRVEVGLAGLRHAATISTHFDIDKYRYAVAISTGIDIQRAPEEVPHTMYDNVAAWMIAGGHRAESPDHRGTRHRDAIREAHRTSRTERPGVLGRMRARFSTGNTSSTLDCCGA